jgi:Na+/proline symporter
MQLSTMADFWRVTYGPAAEVVGACIQVPAYFPWVALQYVALANVFELYFGLPQTVGILIVAAVTLVCTLGGGLWSVTLTDTIQIVIGLGGLVVLTAAALADPRLGDGDPLRGLVMVFTTVAAKHPDHLRLVPSDASPTVLLGWLAAWATGLFGNVPVQDLQQRVFAARSGTAAMLGCILAGVAYLACAMLPVTLGLASLVTHPEGQLDPVGYLAGQYLSTGMLVVFVVSVASIVVSTATSAVLAPAAILGLARGLHDRTSRRRGPQRPLHGRHHRAVRDVGARLRYGWLRAGHRRLPAGQCVAVFENRLSTTTPATISPMPTIAAESSFSP